MIKKVNVSFDFDPETNTVKNVNCFVDGVEKVKKTTTSKKTKDKKEELESTSLITLDSNKLVFNNKAISDMEIEYEDRIVIKYEKIGKENLPIIGKDLAFDEEGSGNKVTKSNSVSYRGKVNTILSEYGTEFELVPYKEGIWRMVSLNQTKKFEQKTLENEIKEFEKNILEKYYKKEKPGYELHLHIRAFYFLIMCNY